MTETKARKWGQFAALLLLVLGGVLLDVVLQGRPVVDLDVGGRDLGFVEGFSAKEWRDDLPGLYGPETRNYRWMGPAGQLRLGPVRADRPLLLRLTMLGGRPAGTPQPSVTVEVSGHAQTTFSLTSVLSEYTLLIPLEALERGVLTVRFTTEVFRVEGDPRDLGFIMDRARLEGLDGSPEGGGWWWQALRRPVYSLAGIALALAALALGASLGVAWGLGMGLLSLIFVFTVIGPGLVLQAGPTLSVLLVLGALVLGGLRWAGPRWRSWARWLGDHAEAVLLVLFLLGLLLAFFPHIEADGVEYYAYLRSLAFDGDMHFDNELSLDVPFAHVPYGLGAKQTSTGFEPNYASVGPAIVWAPFLPAGHLLALAGRALGLGWTVDGYSEPYVVLVCFASTLSALVTLLLGYDLVRRLYGRSLGLLSTVATFLGTTLFYCAFHKPDFAHALAACAVTAFMHLWVRTRGERTRRQWFWLGLAAGFMTTLYWIDAIFCLLPLAELMWGAVRELRARQWGGLRHLVLGGVLFALAFLLAFSPQMVAWKVIFGQWLTVPQEGFATPSSLVPVELVLSPLHGLLPWTPLAVLGGVGLLLLAWDRRPWGVFVLLAFGAFFLYNATLGSWHGGGTYGLRRLTNAFPFLLLGVAALLDRIRRWRPAAAVVTAVLPTLWALMVLLRYQAYTIPHYPSELEGLSLREFLFAPGNFPLSRIGDTLKLSFFVQWVRRLQNNFRWADLLYGSVLLALFVGISLGVWKAWSRWRAKAHVC
jgi:hypothetical protein